MMLVHVSDLHFGSEDEAAIAAAESFIRDRKPAFVIASGDLTAIGRPCEFDAVFAWLANLPAQIVVTPGNHDTPYFKLWPRLVSPFALFYRGAAGFITRAFKAPGVAFAPINTARGVQLRKNWALGAISRRQTRAAADFIAAADPNDLRIVVTHHPLAWPEGAPIEGDTRGGAQAMDRLIDAGADLFLSGHLHTAHLAVFERGGRAAAAISSGTLSIRQRGNPQGFVAIEKKADGVDLTALEIDGGGRAVVGNQLVLLKKNSWAA
jgi:3',5'-cyclic AMP phosphodiesterase CpdA